MLGQGALLLLTSLPQCSAFIRSVVLPNAVLLRASQQQDDGAVELMTLDAPKAAFLVSKWKTTMENDIALGHLPQHTHPHRNVARLLRTSQAFKATYASCSALAVASGSDAQFNATQTKTRVVGTLRSKVGAALAVVRDETESVDVLHVVINPDTRTDSALLAEVEIINALRREGRPVRLAKSARTALDASDAELSIVIDVRSPLGDALASNPSDGSGDAPVTCWLALKKLDD